MSYEFHFTQQGWQCPVCGAVYSPMTIQCVNCTGWKVTNNYEGTNVEEKDSSPYTMVRQIQDSESVSDGQRKASMGEGNQRLPHSENETPKEEAQATMQPHPCKECNKYGCDVHCPYYGK